LHPQNNNNNNNNNNLISQHFVIQLKVVNQPNQATTTTTSTITTQMATTNLFLQDHLRDHLQDRVLDTTMIIIRSPVHQLIKLNMVKHTATVEVYKMILILNNSVVHGDFSIIISTRRILVHMMIIQVHLIHRDIAMVTSTISMRNPLVLRCLDQGVTITVARMKTLPLRILTSTDIITTTVPETLDHLQIGQDHLLIHQDMAMLDLSIDFLHRWVHRSLVFIAIKTTLINQGAVIAALIIQVQRALLQVAIIQVQIILDSQQVVLRMDRMDPIQSVVMLGLIVWVHQEVHLVQARDVGIMARTTCIDRP